MNLTYFDNSKTSHLIKNFYHISYSDKIVPFNTRMIPLGYTGFTFVYSKGQKICLDNNETILKDLVLNGQFSKSYKLIINKTGFSCGLNFKPTALHKLTNLDVSKFTNKHSYFKNINTDLYSKLKSIFNNHNEDFKTLFINLEKLLLSIPLFENKNTEIIDDVVNYIHQKEGLLSIKDLLERIPFSQKTLETQFKKMVGLTPAKYIRIHRFLNLMKQFENHKIDLKDLIYMYDYYDESHFSKDFKSFTSKHPNEYFNEDFSLVKKAIKNK